MLFLQFIGYMRNCMKGGVEILEGADISTTTQQHANYILVYVCKLRTK